MSITPPARRSPQFTLTVALVLTAIVISALAMWQPVAFYRAWLVAALWGWSISLGALSLRLIHLLTGGHWGTAAATPITRATQLMPLSALLFVPWAFGLESVYPWMHPETFDGIQHVSNRIWYFQPGFVIGRMILYFIVWSVLALLVAGPSWSRRIRNSEHTESPRMLDTDPHVQLVPGGQATAGLGLVAVVLTASWAAMDWVMSLDPFFVSTLFGALIGMGVLLAGLAAVVACYCFTAPVGPADDAALPDLANLLLAFVMLWAYMALSQFLIMWSGNLPREAHYYEIRNTGAWNAVSVFLVVGGFVVPLGCLMSRSFKRRRKAVGTLALWLLLVHLVELCWLVLPRGEASASASVAMVIPVSACVIGLWSLLLVPPRGTANGGEHGQLA